MTHTITDQSARIAELATQAAGHLKLMFDAADPQDKQAAFDAYSDVLLLIGRISIDNYEGRTALLSGLVVELSEVTRSIKVKNPVMAQLDTLAGIAGKALDLIKSEKADKTKTA